MTKPSDTAIRTPDEALLAEVTDRARADMVRATWLYFVEQTTQSEIAEILGLTRFRVNRMLADARAEGLVRVEITAALASCVALERRLTMQFGLTDAVVVPAPSDPRGLTAMVGAGLARYLAAPIEDSATRVLGIGWGQTMREMIRHLRPVDRPDLAIVTLLGALSRATEENSIEIIALLGKLLRGERHYMTAPIYAATPEAREVLCAQPFFKEIHRLILSADTACFAVGDMTESSLLIRHALPAGIPAADLVAAGAVGDILGTFVDAEGRPVDHPVNRQLVGPDLADLARLRCLVLASGGPSKRPAVAAALASGVVDVLVTDEDTAAALLAQH